MLYKIKDILDCRVVAEDGDVGFIKDVYFDDASWGIRYFVVEAGKWLSRNEVLLVPSCIAQSDPNGGVFRTTLTCEQVKNSPAVTVDMPVSRQYEERLHGYYGWLPYWDMPLYSAPGLYVYPPLATLDPFGMAMPPSAGSDARGRLDREIMYRQPGDPHLRNFREIKGYHIEASDGRIGHITDCLVDPLTWRLTHMVIDTHNWLPGKHVVIDSGFVGTIDWGASQVTVNLTRESILAAPAYDPERLNEDAYLTSLSSHYRTAAASRRRERIGSDRDFDHNHPTF